MRISDAVDRILSFCLSALIRFVVAPAAIAERVTRQLSFSAGSDGTTPGRKIRGDESIRYVFGARAGQRMTVEMATTNTSTYFDITGPIQTVVFDAVKG